MNKEQFNTIMYSLECRTTLCKRFLDKIYSTEDIGALTINAAVDLKSFCVAEEKIMTKICMVDLYHIIGMGNLTPIQMVQFTYSIKEYLSYRPAIKAIMNNLDSITDLPKIPVKTQYRLQGLGGVVLTAGEGHEVAESVEDFCTYETTTNNLPFRLSERFIKVDKQQLDYFITLMSSIYNTELSLDRFKQKVDARSDYMGITWTEVTDSEIIGAFKSNDTYLRVANYLNRKR